MPDIRQVLKEEVSRLARKEIRASIAPLTSQIAALKQKLSEQKKKTDALEKQLLGVKNAKPVTPVDAIKKPVDEQKRTRVSSNQIKKLRNKLGLNQAQLATLLGVNVNSVALWEQGKVVPRAAAKQKIASLRSLSKKELKQFVKVKPKKANAKKRIAKKTLTTKKQGASAATVKTEAPK